MAAGFLNALAAIPQGFMQGRQYAIDQSYQQALRDLAIQQQRQQMAQNLQRQQALGLLYRAYGQAQPQQNPNPFGQPADLQAAQQFAPPPQIPQQQPQPLPQVPRYGPDVLNRPPTPAMLPTIADKESSGGANRYNPTPTSSGNAEGLYGITTGTWRDFAPKAGVSLASAPTPNAADDATQGRVAQQIPLKRWDAKTVAAVQQLPPEHQQAASQTAVSAAASMPPQLAGQLNPQQLKEMIERSAEPGTPDEVKGAALIQLQHLMKPDFQEQLQLYEFGERQKQHKEDKKQQEREFGIREKETETQHEFNRIVAGQRLSQGQQRIDQGGARSMPGMVMKKFFDENPDATYEDAQRVASEYRRNQSIESAFGGGVMGRNLVSINTLADHIEMLRSYGDALKNKDLVAANQVLDRMATQAGWPETINYALAGTITGDETIRLLTTTGGSESDRQGIQKLLSPYNSPDQIQGAIDTLENYARSRYAPLRQSYARGDPERERYFNQSMVTPEARRLFEGKPKAPAGPDAATKPGTSGEKIIEKGGKRWRVIGGDPNDPDIEEVK